jgi:inositol-phosphate phosphatase / L-galactose 1-phosphate phosphatase / histidinol-phosphatase
MIIQIELAKSSNNMDYSEYLYFAIKMAKSAGDILKSNYDLMISSADFLYNNAEYKGQNKEIVTKAEQQAEALMRNMVEEQYPDHDVAGEELGYSLTDKDFLWVFDPVDGTAAMVESALNFKKNINPTKQKTPHFGITIAALHNNQPIISVIYDFLNEHMWTVAGNSPPLLNGEAINLVTEESSLQNCILCSTAPEIMFTSQAQKQSFAALSSQILDIHTNKNCIGFMQLLTGEVDIVWEGDLAFHDVVALVPILRNANIAISFENGDPIIFSKQNYHSEYRIIAARPKLHDLALKIINEKHDSGQNIEKKSETSSLYSKKF